MRDEAAVHLETLDRVADAHQGEDVELRRVRDRLGRRHPEHRVDRVLSECGTAPAARSPAPAWTVYTSCCSAELGRGLRHPRPGRSRTDDVAERHVDDVVADLDGGDGAAGAKRCGSRGRTRLARSAASSAASGDRPPRTSSELAEEPRAPGRVADEVDRLQPESRCLARGPCRRRRGGSRVVGVVVLGDVTSENAVTVAATARTARRRRTSRAGGPRLGRPADLGEPVGGLDVGDRVVEQGGQVGVVGSITGHLAGRRAACAGSRRRGRHGP